MAKSDFKSVELIFSFSLHNNDTVAKYPSLAEIFILSFSLHNNDTVAK
ncbi:MAG: hypothetical protein ACRCVI_01060 [Mycoplasmoidaceae bacterium]